MSEADTVPILQRYANGRTEMPHLVEVGAAGDRHFRTNQRTADEFS